MCVYIYIYKHGVSQFIYYSKWNADPYPIFLLFSTQTYYYDDYYYLVGGKFDNGGRFDLRLPYADQGYVDEDADAMKKLSNFFGGGNKKKPAAESKKTPADEEPPKKKNWPW